MMQHPYGDKHAQANTKTHRNTQTTHRRSTVTLRNNTSNVKIHSASMWENTAKRDLFPIEERAYKLRITHVFYKNRQTCRTPMVVQTPKRIQKHTEATNTRINFRQPRSTTIHQSLKYTAPLFGKTLPKWTTVVHCPSMAFAKRPTNQHSDGG